MDTVEAIFMCIGIACVLFVIGWGIYKVVNAISDIDHLENGQNHIWGEIRSMRKKIEALELAVATKKESAYTEWLKRPPFSYYGSQADTEENKETENAED